MPCARNLHYSPRRTLVSHPDHPFLITMSSVSPREAVYVSPPGLRVPAANIYSFLFSNPFLANNIAIETAPLPAQRAHHLPGPVPHDKSLYVDSVTDAAVSWIRARDDALQVAQGLGAMPFLQPAPFEVGQKNVMSPIVMILLPNCVVYAPVLFGVWAAGLTASTVNPLRESLGLFAESRVLTRNSQ